eukprot:3594454-Rhodomonas_salina.3
METRTLPDPEHTSAMGSSMGGLCAFQVLLSRPPFTPAVQYPVLIASNRHAICRCARYTLSGTHMLSVATRLCGSARKFSRTARASRQSSR